MSSPRDEDLDDPVLSALYRNLPDERPAAETEAAIFREVARALASPNGGNVVRLPLWRRRGVQAAMASAAVIVLAITTLQPHRDAPPLVRDDTAPAAAIARQESALPAAQSSPPAPAESAIASAEVAASAAAPAPAPASDALAGMDTAPGAEEMAAPVVAMRGATASDKAREPTPGAALATRFIEYPPGEVILPATATTTVAAHARFLADHPRARLALRGQANEGDGNARATLAQDRATALREFMIRLGAPGSRIDDGSSASADAAVPGTREEAGSGRGVALIYAGQEP